MSSEQWLTAKRIIFDTDPRNPKKATTLTGLEMPYNGVKLSSALARLNYNALTVNHTRRHPELARQSFDLCTYLERTLETDQSFSAEIQHIFKTLALSQAVVIEWIGKMGYLRGSSAKNGYLFSNFGRDMYARWMVLTSAFDRLPIEKNHDLFHNVRRSQDLDMVVKLNRPGDWGSFPETIENMSRSNFTYLVEVKGSHCFVAIIHDYSHKFVVLDIQESLSNSNDQRTGKSASEFDKELIVPVHFLTRNIDMRVLIDRSNHVLFFGDDTNEGIGSNLTEEVARTLRRIVNTINYSPLAGVTGGIPVESEDMDAESAHN
ncbi:MAG: hypothetical protein AAB893_02600, partial [Patescibacteria group bacterium]